MNLPTDFAALLAQVANLATGIDNNIAGLSGVETYDGQARVSAQAALSSENAAASSASTASSKATAASGSATAAQTSATNAASSATSASGSASSAATDVTNAANSASAASTSATNAGSSNTSAQGYNNRVQTLQQVAPIAAATSVTGGASTTWSATASFTAPCNGWVFARGTFNLYQPGSASYQCTLYINGNDVGGDTTNMDQVQMGVLEVSEGATVTVTMQAVSPSTAPQQGGTLHMAAWFIMGTA
jgi:hypothetical protein